jgi:hypothetical protein
MPEDDDPVLYPPDTRSPEQSKNAEEQQAPLTPEEQALVDDLNVYHNPEVFEDASLPQIYKLYIHTTHLPDVPFILDIEVNGTALPDLLRETMIVLMKRQPGFGDEEAKQMRAETKADQEYLDFELEMRRFYVRHFPKLMTHIAEIATTMSVVFATGKLLLGPGNVREKMSRTLLKELLQAFEKDVKKMLETRSSGRPKKIDSESSPKIVNDVLDIAREIMGDKSGEVTKTLVVGRSPCQG